MVELLMLPAPGAPAVAGRRRAPGEGCPAGHDQGGLRGAGGYMAFAPATAASRLDFYLCWFMPVRIPAAGHGHHGCRAHSSCPDELRAQAC